jgi:aryl-alcohol dehydrogenase-like predicted oxidoreductase
MDYVRLGTTGLKVSRLCLGTMTFGSPKWRSWTMDEKASRPLIKAALEAGITFFDTADVYSIGESEIVVGNALRDFARRDQIVLATKVHGKMGEGPNDRGLSRKHIMDSIDASLRRLRTDYVDLYQIHRWDKETPIEETLEALNDVVRAGKARYLGASSMWAWQFHKALTIQRHAGHARFVSMQNHYNLVYREEEREMIPLCLAEGVGLIPWSPLARGFLAGNRRRQDKGETERAKADEFAHQLYYTDADFQIVDKLVEIANKHGRKPIQVALAWMLSKPAVSAPIVGITKEGQLGDLIGALDLRLGPEEIEALEAPYRPRAVMGHS